MKRLLYHVESMLTPYVGEMFDRASRSPHSETVPAVWRSGTKDEDVRLATDIVVETQPCDIRIQVHQRRFKNYGHWMKDFSLRGGVRGNGPSEVEKVLSGCVDFVAYALEGRKGDRLIGLRLLDMAVFRRHYPHVECDKRPNGQRGRDGVLLPDGTEGWYFRYDAFPPDLIVADIGEASSHWHPQIGLFRS